MLASMSLAFGSLLFGIAAMAAPDAAVPTAHAATTRERIVLDGALDEAAWRNATPIRLTQQDPKPGEPTPYDTQVRVLVDGAHLYLGISCTDPAFARRSVHTLERDSDQSGDDHVTIVLDTFGAHRT